MVEQLHQLKEQALSELSSLDNSSEAVKHWLKKYTGKDSQLTQTLKGIKDLPAEQRAEVGKTANQLKQELQQAGQKALEEYQNNELEEQLNSEFLDLTLPGLPAQSAGLHPITQERKRAEQIFERMGFAVWDPYLVDSDYNNFTALNIPPGHPARDMWDTLRINDEQVMITHTSSMQNRIISSQEPPIRAIVPGKTFRNEATDARHEHSFFQLEGIYVDRGIKLSDLIGTLKQFLTYYFEQETELKIQPTYFPFVEPGLEIMMNCPVCQGEKNADCEGCGGSGWMEIVPGGQIHPFVIEEAGLDPNVYSGFAWGMGLERLIMIKNSIDDIRNFHSGRIDFVNQFNQK